MSEPELLPCPFCGSPAELERSSDHHGEWFNLGCSRHWGRPRNPDRTTTCIAGRAYYTETEVPEPEAIAAWNQRAPLYPDPVELVEALRDILGAIDEGQDFDPINSDYVHTARTALSKWEKASKGDGE